MLSICSVLGNFLYAFHDFWSIYDCLFIAVSVTTSLLFLYNVGHICDSICF